MNKYRKPAHPLNLTVVIFRSTSRDLQRTSYVYFKFSNVQYLPVDIHKQYCIVNVHCRILEKEMDTAFLIIDRLFGFYEYNKYFLDHFDIIYF